MDCPECDRLTTEYQRLKRLYLIAVEILFATGYDAADAEYAKLKNSVEEARGQSEISAFKLARHKLAVHSESD